MIGTEFMIGTDPRKVVTKGFASIPSSAILLLSTGLNTALCRVDMVVLALPQVSGHGLEYKRKRQRGGAHVQIVSVGEWVCQTALPEARNQRKDGREEGSEVAFLFGATLLV